jgi:hypothetical protein
VAKISKGIEIPYSQENFDEALRLRKAGNDNATIRMILVSKKLTAADIDELFFALNDALPRKKAKGFGAYEGAETSENIERRDFYILILALMVIGAVLAGIGYLTDTNVLWVLGIVLGFFGLWGFGRSYNDDREEREEDND